MEGGVSCRFPFNPSFIFLSSDFLLLDDVEKLSASFFFSEVLRFQVLVFVLLEILHACVLVCSQRRVGLTHLDCPQERQMKHHLHNLTSQR